jgi:hypothetical protein
MTSARVPRGLRAAAATAAAAWFSGCVTQVVDDPSAFEALTVEPVRIPLFPDGADPKDRAAVAFYTNVLTQVHEAFVDRDLELLRGVLATHDRASAPDWVRAQLSRYRTLAAGLEFELHVEEVAELAQEAPAALGESVGFEFRVPTSPRPDVSIPGSGGEGGLGPVRFLVRCEVEDFDCLGGRSRRAFSELLELPESEDFSSRDGLVMPFEIDGADAEGAYRRLRVEVDMMPGAILIGGVPVPIHRVACADAELALYPRGVELIRDNPYTNLREGLRSGDPAHFNHVFLAAHFMTDEFREDAVRQLIGHLRLGRPEQQQVIMASLSVLVGEEFRLREDWLRWWQRRAAGGRSKD